MKLDNVELIVGSRKDPSVSVRIHTKENGWVIYKKQMPGLYKIQRRQKIKYLLIGLVLGLIAGII